MKRSLILSHPFAYSSSSFRFPKRTYQKVAWTNMIWIEIAIRTHVPRDTLTLLPKKKNLIKNCVMRARWCERQRKANISKFSGYSGFVRLLNYSCTNKFVIFLSPFKSTHTSSDCIQIYTSCTWNIGVSLGRTLLFPTHDIASHFYCPRRTEKELNFLLFLFSF